MLFENIDSKGTTLSNPRTLAAIPRRTLSRVWLPEPHEPSHYFSHARTCMTALLTFHPSGLGDFMARCHSCSALSPSDAVLGLPARPRQPELVTAVSQQITQSNMH